MELSVILLILLPFIFSITVLKLNLRQRDIITYIYTAVLLLLGIVFFIFNDIVKFNFHHTLDIFFIIFDIVLLFYFLQQGIKNKNYLVSWFAFIQLFLYTFIMNISSSTGSVDILVDRISALMLLVINTVGSIIIVYALKYIESENFDRFKKNSFIALLFFFISVMNLVVTTNNLEMFFLAFELTTLCSYLLIRYRGDDISNENALRALWMNQIGGVAILLCIISSVIYYDTIYFDILLQSANGLFLFPLALLSIAAFVKGASLPFEKWLLGAMAAPTPVSAILHSAAMVKIAPYLILKIASSFTPLLSSFITLFGSFVFMGASLYALSKDYFKEILALSTIALLALMMSVAAFGTEEAVNICLMLMVFHAVSKALLFFQAGVLEKVYHLKYLKDINYLSSSSRSTVFFILLGFASLTLPPFGAFIGKFDSIELIVSYISISPLYIFSLLFILLGSVFLTLLYFKILTKMMPQNNNIVKQTNGIPFIYTFTSSILSIFVIIGLFVSFIYDFLSIVQLVVPSLVILLTIILFYAVDFKSAHRVKEYNCAEKDQNKIGVYYFNIDHKYQRVVFYCSIVLITVIVLVSL